MNEPKKKKRTEQELDALFDKAIQVPSFTKPANLSDWETAYQNVYGGKGTAADSIKLGLKMSPYQQAQDARSKAKFNIDYQTKLLNLREKQKEAGVGLEDISKKRSEFFKKIGESQNILNKTVKSTKIDEEGVEYDTEKPAYPYQARQQAKKTVSAYSDSLRTLNLVEKLRGQGIQANMSDVVSFFKKAEKPIDAMTQEMIKRGFTKEQALVFKNTAMEIVKEGNSPETAMKRAAEHINIMFGGDIFNRE